MIKDTIIQSVLMTTAVIYAAMVGATQKADSVNPMGHKQGPMAMGSLDERSNVVDYDVFGRGASEIPASNSLVATDADDSKNAQEVDAKRETYLIYFTAKWCGPCRSQKPVIEEIKAEGKHKVYIVDIDEQPGLADSWGVTVVPTIEIVKESKRTYKFVGAGHDRKKLEQLLD